MNLSLSVKEFCKAVHICKSYQQKSSVGYHFSWTRVL